MSSASETTLVEFEERLVRGACSFAPLCVLLRQRAGIEYVWGQSVWDRIVEKLIHCGMLVRYGGQPPEYTAYYELSTDVTFEQLWTEARRVDAEWRLGSREALG